ncbi:MAG TPA: pitrilysin family protein [Pyrinomonadaceae bacterium]|nr:pitrilysin family protein [Pyrinomonadaceae bacterium]
MRNSIFALLTLLAFATASFGQIKVQPIDLKERTLSNGLRVVTVQDNSNPTVSIHVWYNVGGKNDPPGRSGFAHMFEHMMFKATKHMPDEKFDRLTEDVGGFNNASTWPDYTNYYEVVPSNHLERLLWAEADRMVNLNVDEKSFASEREVVKEEYRQGVLAPPYGKLFWLMDDKTFEKHPYRRGVIGNLDELSAATRADAEAFYKTFYRPDNAVLIVVGDFEQKQADAWIDKYFGSIAKPSGSIPRVTEVEPAWTQERRYNEFGPRVPFPAIAVVYQAPKTTSPDIPAIRLAGAILSGGASSRLYQSLVREQQIAQQANLDLELNAEGGRLSFVGIGSEKGTSENLEKAWLAELAKIQKDGVTEKELQKAKNGYMAGAIRTRETNDGKAILIERAVAYNGDPKAVNRELDAIQAVTVDDIKRVMNKYFKPNNRVVINYSQAPAKAEEVAQ